MFNIAVYAYLSTPSLVGLLYLFELEMRWYFEDHAESLDHLLDVAVVAHRVVMGTCSQLHILATGGTFLSDHLDNLSVFFFFCSDRVYLDV